MKLRLDKYLCDALLIPRSDARDAVRAGRVTVAGKSVRDPGEKVDPAWEILFDGTATVYREHRYLMMNKPAGVLSATEDGKDRTVLDLLPPQYRAAELFPAGRLDKDAEGLLLLTTDGDYCHRVISPKSDVKKRYYAVAEGLLTDRHVRAFAEGLHLGDGMDCLPGKLELLSVGAVSECIVTIREGKFHQVKRMLASCGAPVRYLRRLSIGNLFLDPSLAPGECRELTDEERNAVFDDPAVTEK